MNPIIANLLQAKRHSDKCEYREKGAIIKSLLEKYPKQFEIDSRQKTTVGLTHKPTGFRIHSVKSVLPLNFLSMQKVANPLARLAPKILSAVKNVARPIRDAWNPNAARPLFGAEGAAAARKGVTWLSDVVPNNGGPIESLGVKFLDSHPKIKQMLGFGNIELDPSKLKNAKGFVGDLIGSAEVRNMKPAPGQFVGKTQFDRLSRTKGDKFLEASPNQFGPWMPQTELLKNLLNKGGVKRNMADWHNQVRTQLDARFGKDRWILKKRDGANSKHIPGQLFKPNHDLTTLPKNPNKWVAQELQDINQVRLLRNPTIKANQEFRVHAAQGRRVPFATAERGAGRLRSYMSMLFPGRNARAAEKLVDEALASGKYKGDFGFDIGIRSNGKPFIVEANPTEMATRNYNGGVSGYMTDVPIVGTLNQQAMTAAVKGTVPPWVLARRALHASMASGAGYGGYQGYQTLTGQNQPQIPVNYLQAGNPLRT